LRQRLSGIEAATFPEGMRSGASGWSCPKPSAAADFLDNTLLRSATGQYVPLGDIVGMQTRQGFSTIQRENGVQLVTVSGAISEDDPARARAIQDELRATILPRLSEDFGIETRLSGLAEQERDFLTDAVLGLIACLLGDLPDARLGLFQLDAPAGGDGRHPLRSHRRPLRPPQLGHGDVDVLGRGHDGDGRDHHQRFDRAGDDGRSVRARARPHPLDRRCRLRPSAAGPADHADDDPGPRAASLRTLQPGAVSQADGGDAGLRPRLRHVPRCC
jgi:hypothetical protein